MYVMINIKTNIEYKIILTIILYSITLALSAEGTKQLWPEETQTCWIRPSKSGKYGKFASPDAGSNGRLYISIANVNEKINLGFNVNTTVATPPVNLTYRIIFESTNAVIQSGVVPSSGDGYIKNYENAIAGPNVISGSSAQAFKPITVAVTQIGNYYIEFDWSNNINNGGDDVVELMYFDCTVSRKLGGVTTEKLGRLWSRNWVLNTNGSNNPTYSKLYVYSVDKIVTSIDLNGMKPWGFNISCNATGCYNTGNTTLDRRSVNGNHTYPQYQVFLNDPDITLFPSGILGSITNINAVPSCDGTVDFQISATKDGSASILVEINPAPGIQPEDVTLGGNVQQNIINHFYWNGMSGTGIPVSNGVEVTISLTYINGLTNLPLYDVEENTNGIKASLVRPTGSAFNTFWVDTLLYNKPYPVIASNLSGCSNPSGCHTWTATVGNENTINTWWYSHTSTSLPLKITTKRNYLKNLNITMCDGDSTLFYGTWVKSNGVYQERMLSILTGCDSIEQITVVLLPKPSLPSVLNVEYCDYQTTTIGPNSNIGYTYLWNTGQTTSQITPSVSGVYILQTSGTNGCKTESRYNLTINKAYPVTPIEHY